VVTLLQALQLHLVRYDYCKDRHESELNYRQISGDALASFARASLFKQSRYYCENDR
jgi:hypothetical protein